MVRVTAGVAAAGLAVLLAAAPAAAGDRAMAWVADGLYPFDGTAPDHIAGQPAALAGDPDYTGQAAGWCARGALFSTVFAVGFAVPAIASGAAAPLGAAELAATAGTGCGFSILWGSAISSAVWAARTYFIEPSLAIPPAAPTMEAAVDGEAFQVVAAERPDGSPLRR
ncbi:hypothetical protein [Azospirillum sp. ST 5-10]|uniref:hypothetical protein n=1 Tax=unclassified Azospirillum TaxID=2630922 RepID=UPI003F4A15DF